MVHDVLASAYAEGRLDREELDERTAQVDGAKTYADLVAPMRDLAADATPSRLPPVASQDLRRSAEQYYSNKLRETFFEFLVPNLICWAIWFMTGHDYFVWPVFVTIPTLLHVVQVGTSKQRTIDSRVEKLQRKEAKALEPPPSSTPSTSSKSNSSTSPTSGEKILSEHEKPDEA